MVRLKQKYIFYSEMDLQVPPNLLKLALAQGQLHHLPIITHGSSAPL